MELLRVEKLCKSYESFELRDVSFSLESGYIMGFVGRNGAGKTTTLKSILGLVHADAGSVSICGLDTREHELDCRRQTGVVFGEFDFYKNKRLSLLTNIQKRFYPDWDEAAYRKYLELFALDEHKRVAELSSGMKVKYALTLALSHGAKLLILDEPTSGLDPISRDELLDTFRTVIEDGEHSILFSTHITSDLEKCADYITYIKNGSIVFTDEHAALREKYMQAKGTKDALTDETRGMLIGVRENMFGFDALVSADHADAARAAGLELGAADIETIMIHMEKE